MKTAKAVAQKPVITESQVREFIAARRTFDLLSQEFKSAEEAYRTIEGKLIALLDQGYSVEGPHDLVIMTTERRNVGWKQVCSEHLSAERVAAILEAWPVTVTCKLQVK